MNRLRLLMDVAVQPSESEIDTVLSERIVALGMDAAFEEFPQKDLSEPLEFTLRREAEERFQRALSTRTWWRLSREERSTISAMVKARNPWAYTSPDSPWLESECRKVILHVLENASHSA